MSLSQKGANNLLRALQQENWREFIIEKIDSYQKKIFSSKYWKINYAHAQWFWGTTTHKASDRKEIITCAFFVTVQILDWFYAQDILVKPYQSIAQPCWPFVIKHWEEKFHLQKCEHVILNPFDLCQLLIKILFYFRYLLLFAGTLLFFERQPSL